MIKLVASSHVQKLTSSHWFRVGALTLVFTVLIGLVVPLSNRANAAASFVGRSGSHFTLNGQPWYVAGTNNHYLGWGSQAEVDRVLNDAKTMHFNVIRTILHSVRGSLDGTTVPTKWNWGSNGDTGNMGMHGVYILYWDPASHKMAYNDSSTDGLGRWDYVIMKAGQLGLKLDISLLDFWQWAGGAQQINANLKGGSYDMSSAPDRYTFFFQDASAIQFYKDWVNHVLNRINTLTGIAYKNDPTIFAWDLMNEPEIGGMALGQGWISEMAAYIKTIDRYHLLGTGNEGFADAHAGTNVSMDVLNQPNIDFATWHTYPDYHSITPANVVTLIDQNCATGASGGKPVLMQEFGYNLEHSNQPSVYQSWVDELYNQDCAGWTFWRLTSIEDTGGYPPNNGEGFDIHNDGSASANVFINAALRSSSRQKTDPTATPPALLTPLPTFVPGMTITPTPTPITGTPLPQAFTTFVQGVDIAGPAVTIEGHPWLSYAAALSQGLSQTGGVSDGKHVSPDPATDAATASMLNSLLYASKALGKLSLAQQIGNGNYQVYLWEMENFQSNSRRFDVQIEGTQVASGLGNLPLKGWAKYGPYNATVRDDVLNIDLISTQGRAMIMGFAIFSNGISAQPTATPQALMLPTTTSQPNNPGPTATSVGLQLASGHANIAPGGTGYTWFNVGADFAGNQRTEPRVNDNNLAQDFPLTGSGDDNLNRYNAAGVIWASPQTITSVQYINGACDQYQKGTFTGDLRVQFTTDGANWTTDNSWSVSPAYPYDSCAAGGQRYTFGGTIKSGVKGVRVIGGVHSTNTSHSWYAIGREVLAFN